MPGLGTIFLSETIGTAILLLLGGGVVANNILPKNKGKDAGFLMVTFGWGIAVLAGAITANQSGAHINPAVTIGLAVQDWLNGGHMYNATNIATYFAGQMLGAFIGAILCWLAYRKQFDLADDPGLKLGVFSTGPEDRDYFWNTVTEAIGTFVLVFVIMAAGLLGTASPVVNLGWLNYLGVALLVVGIGTSLGGPTGYAINPARDLGPRIAHAILPIRGKGSSDWAYSWVPVVGPMVGAILAGIAAHILL